MGLVYFAYGSNMLRAWLARRCPSARTVSRAIAIGHSLSFSKVSTDGSGKATLVEEPNVITPGVLYELDSVDLPSLDRAEGAGLGYVRCESFPVRIIESNAAITATTYLATEIDSRLKPYDWYLALVVAGATENQLDDSHIVRLSTSEYIRDADLTRKNRLEALTALGDRGIPDYTALLNS